MYTTIIFDYGGVLGSDADAWDTNFVSILRQTGLNRQEIDDIWEHHWDAMKLGAKSVEDFWKEVYEKSKSEITPSTLEDMYRENITINADMVLLIKSLKVNGYKLGILANESLEWMNIKIQKFNLYSLIPHTYGSAHLGFAKPDPLAYQFVLNKLKSTPQETIFVDNLERNTQAAKKLDMCPILYTNTRALRKELEEVNIRL